VATLGDLVKTVFTDGAYAVEYGMGLEGCPVVYRFGRRGETREDLVSLCQALYLKCEFDEAKRTVSITRGPRLAASLRARRWQSALARLATEVRPFLNADAKQILSASRALRRQAEEETDPWGRKRIQQRDTWLRLLLESEGAILVRSLAASPEGNARTMAHRCAPANQVMLSTDARPLWGAFTRGQGFYTSDLKDPEMVGKDLWEYYRITDEERRNKAAQIVARGPIPMIKHTDWSATLFLVTPTTSEFARNLDLSDPMGPDALAPLPADIARVPVRFQAAWKDGGRSLNDLSPLAGDLKLNFASWLSINPLPRMIGASLQEGRQRGFGLDAARAGSWLGIHNALEPLTQTSPGWRLFLRLLPHYEREATQPQPLLPRLEELTRTEIAALEGIGTEGYFFLPERFRPLASGIRLYRSALRWHLAANGGAGKATIPYDDLPKESRDDVREFLRSEHAFAFYPQFLHPANANHFRRVSLTVERGMVDGRLTLTSVGLGFPSDWNPVVNNSPIEFSIKTPVHPEG
jgi:hypothetical protein